ncbi:MAG: DNA ligase, partial [Patescibacteria group bacterium]
MTFSELSKYFEKLEGTSSRLALIDILSDLFKHASKDEIDKIVYLTQGRIAPFFEPLEIGMAEKSVAQALAVAYGSDKERVLALYNKLGDMGLVAEDMNKRHPRENEDRFSIKSRMTVPDAFEILTKIARTSGEGTVEKRQ